MKNLSTNFVLLLANLALVSFAFDADAARSWPVSCAGPIPGLVKPLKQSHNTLVVSLQPKAGSVPGNPQIGECVWQDRPMNRPGEFYGKRQTNMEFQVPKRFAQLKTKSGQHIYSFPGYPEANKIWERSQKEGRFQMNIRRIGKGHYEIVLPPRRVARAVPAPSRNDRGMVRATPAPRAEVSPVNVAITIDKIKVIDDGDSVSPGDWFVNLVALASSNENARQAVESLRQPARSFGDRIANISSKKFTGTKKSGVNVVSKRWPATGTKNVSSGKSYNPQMEIFLRNIDPSSDWLVVNIMAVDCDSDGPFDLLDINNLILPHRLPSNVLAGNISGKCSGEEIFEVSGNPDIAHKTIELPPTEWRSGKSFSHTISGNGLKYKVQGRIRVVR